MTNNDRNPATATATGILEAAPGTAAPHDKDSKKGEDSKKNKDTKKNKAQWRAAKALAYFALIFTGLMVLAEPWLLIPVAALLLAISLWD
ncbi:hypothetical protein HUT19_01050 [Streptomyces sp. NA02950]|uniref:hypothetical protein n=1 Tax=Streptomyces sp. NA02950 TaxID=2742137 RepID=UPI00158FDB54|nr:hypothetical protein [Streptomyces sp. NA02950]QKV90536.1 hypothetical protein HUT19_01050 [Streptomyces sp. NA02950]